MSERRASRSLLFDAGNTYLKWGVLENGVIRRSGRLAHEKLSKSGFNALTTRIPARADAAILSNVAGTAFATRLSGIVGLHTGLDLQIAKTTKTACGISNGYRQPRTLGVDRWLAMIGAYQGARTALCVVDAGTAITVDALDKEGNHIGGLILPGLRLMMESLNSDTSDIRTSGQPRSVEPGIDGFGRRTSNAVTAGSLFAAAGAIEHAVGCLRGGGVRAKIVLTGGDASSILKHLNSKVIHRPNLVLEGLAVMLQSDA